MKILPSRFDARYPCEAHTGNPADTFVYRSDDPPLGTTIAYETGSGELFDLSAQLEPDADRDGFGDDTQDGCPRDAVTQGPCRAAVFAPPPPFRPPPDRTGPLVGIARRAVTLTSQGIVGVRLFNGDHTAITGSLSLESARKVNVAALHAS